MRVTLESTTRIVLVNGHQARVWEGATDAGVRVFFLVPRIAVQAHENQAEFERDLKLVDAGVAPSDQALEAFPSRMVIPQ